MYIAASHFVLSCKIISLTVLKVAVLNAENNFLYIAAFFHDIKTEMASILAELCSKLQNYITYSTESSNFVLSCKILSLTVLKVAVLNTDNNFLYIAAFFHDIKNRNGLYFGR